MHLGAAVQAFSTRCADHRAFAMARLLRIADGPDEVHLRQIFREEPRPRWSVADSPYIVRPTS